MIKSVYGYPKAEFSTTWLKLLEAEFGEAGFDAPTDYYSLLFISPSL